MCGQEKTSQEENRKKQKEITFLFKNKKAGCTILPFYFPQSQPLTE